MKTSKFANSNIVGIIIIIGTIIVLDQESNTMEVDSLEINNFNGENDEVQEKIR